jgi:hypothetical protein
LMSGVFHSFCIRTDLLPCRLIATCIPHGSVAMAVDCHLHSAHICCHAG